MHILATLIFILLNLAGIDIDSHTVTTHVREHGVDQLYSKVHVSPDITIFHCIASTSGVCHYAVFAHACTAHARCEEKPLHRFSVPTGKRRFDTTLPAGFLPCVSTNARPNSARCPSPDDAERLASAMN